MFAWWHDGEWMFYGTEADVGTDVTDLYVASDAATPEGIRAGSTWQTSVKNEFVEVKEVMTVTARSEMELEQERHVFEQRVEAASAGFTLSGLSGRHDRQYLMNTFVKWEEKGKVANRWVYRSQCGGAFAWWNTGRWRFSKPEASIGTNKCSMYVSSDAASPEGIRAGSVWEVKVKYSCEWGKESITVTARREMELELERQKLGQRVEAASAGFVLSGLPGVGHEKQHLMTTFAKWEEKGKVANRWVYRAFEYDVYSGGAFAWWNKGRWRFGEVEANIGTSRCAICTSIDDAASPEGIAAGSVWKVHLNNEFVEVKEVMTVTARSEMELEQERHVFEQRVEAASAGFTLSGLSDGHEKHHLMTTFVKWEENGKVANRWVYRSQCGGAFAWWDTGRWRLGIAEANNGTNRCTMNVYSDAASPEGIRAGSTWQAYISKEWVAVKNSITVTARSEMELEQEQQRLGEPGAAGAGKKRKRGEDGGGGRAKCQVKVPDKGKGKLGMGKGKDKAISKGNAKKDKAKDQVDCTPNTPRAGSKEKKPESRKEGGSEGGGSSSGKPCLLQLCEHFLASLNVDASFLDRAHDRCYCAHCYPDTYPDVITDGPHPYVIPRGW
jgi:hypothetical protein